MVNTKQTIIVRVKQSINSAIDCAIIQYYDVLKETRYGSTCLSPFREKISRESKNASVKTNKPCPSQGRHWGVVAG